MRTAHVPLNLTDTLCTHCGLCCDGTLFGDVELASRTDARRLEDLGLDVEDDDTHGDVLSLPCGALCGTRCSIYSLRPACCREFECRLLQNARRGAVTARQAAAQIAAVRAQVKRVKALLATLESRDHARGPLRERCSEALAGPRHATPEVARRRARLEAAMSRLERTLHHTFLAAMP